MAGQKKDSEKQQTAARGAAKKSEPAKPAAKKLAAKKGAAKPTESAAGAKASGEKKADKPAGSRAKTAAAAKTEGSGAKTTAKPKQAAKAEPKRGAAAKKQPEPEAPAVRARASYVRVAPRKARLVADQVRGLPLEDARTVLRFSPRSAARDIAKLVDSAAANAENNHDLIADELRIADIRVDEGPTLRRYRPRALGRATRINKRTSHIQVALTPTEE